MSHSLQQGPERTNARGGPLRIGVVGLGTWGIEHVRAWRSLPGVALVAVCDRDPARIEACRDDFAGAATYHAADHMAVEEDLDIVSIVGDETQRLPTTLPFIEQGVHVLVEKPIAVTLAEATTMVERARERGVSLMPGHLLRFDARLALLKERIDHGELGTVRSVYARRLIPRGRHDKYARNHPALMAGIHDLDLARWYIGDEPLSVRAYACDSAHVSAPDLLWAVLQFPEGRIAVVETAWVLPDGAGTWLEAETEVIGTVGVAHVRSPADALSVYLPTGREAPETAAIVHALGRTSGSLVEQLSYFASYIEAGREPRRVTAGDGIQSLRLALAVAQSAATGAEVALDQAEIR